MVPDENITTIEGQQTAISQQIILNYFSYGDIYEATCEDDTTGRRRRSLLSTDFNLDPDECKTLNSIIVTSLITLWMIVASIVFVTVTMIVWLIIKMKCCEKCRVG